MARMNDVLERLRGMRGTVHAFVLNDICRDKIWDIEKEIKAALNIPVINKGVEECLHRKHVVCIIKKASFRPPPEPTVMLLTNSGVVLGEEILPPFKKKFLENVKEEIIWLSEEFVIYPERRGGNKEFFVMPPVSFPEVEELGMSDVVSCSPSAPADMMLREMHGYEDDPKLASILVGFNWDGEI
ncbi:MAG: hypothetical protein ISF22_08245 [Methanomassiliicoccus sp.]|nr:hypothetical protein [Methanomassiliicoccus sp.]